ncbi:MAG: outer membrane beta-barrel protein [Bacteroidia bacterium]|nr:outer membrane beta-barrel protein [Bacteroidia bacterium]
MKQILNILVFLFLGLNLGAQSKFSLGPIYSIGASTILSNRPMSEINGGTPIVSKMSLKMSMGAGLRAEYSFSDKWALFLQTGFQQHGTLFKAYMDDFKPRYRLNYLGVIGGAALRTKKMFSNQQFFLNLGLTQQTLLSANRVFDTGSERIASDIKKVDFGMFLGVGDNVHLQGSLLQFQLFATIGARQPFSGNLSANGMSGQNFLSGLQIAYLFGSSENMKAK